MKYKITMEILAWDLRKFDQNTVPYEKIAVGSDKTTWLVGEADTKEEADNIWIYKVAADLYNDEVPYKQEILNEETGEKKITSGIKTFYFKVYSE